MRIRGCSFDDEDHAHDERVQRQLDAFDADWDAALAEDRERRHAKKLASGIAADEVFLQDAYAEGTRAPLGATNPFQPGFVGHDAWARGHAAAHAHKSHLKGEVDG